MESEQPTEQRRTLGRATWWLIMVGVAVVAVGLAFWAGTAVSSPRPTVVDANPVVLYTAVEGQLSTSAAVTVKVSWNTETTVTAGSAGTVTKIASEGVATDGSVVGWIDGTPLVLIHTDTPFYRDLGPGVQGDDVRELQQFLARHGYLAGDVTGLVDPPTVTAIQAFQSAIGLPVTGIFATNAVISTRSAGLIVKPVATWGQHLASGDPIADLLSPQPIFSVQFPEDAGSTRPTTDHSGKSITITPPEGVAGPWTGTLSEPLAAQDGSKIYHLVGGPENCDGPCAKVATGGDVTLAGEVELIPMTRGTAIPTSALVVDPEGATHVVSDRGVSIPVTVLTSDRGQAIVSGLQPGATVRLASQSG